MAVFFRGILYSIGISVITGVGGHHHYHESHEHHHDHYNHHEHNHEDNQSGTSQEKNFSEDNDDNPEYTSIFTNVNFANKSQNFKAGKASSVFGLMVLDLRGINITGNAYFEAASVFGGLEILAPKNVPLRVNITPVFGSFYNNAEYKSPEGEKPYLKLEGAAVFGSIKIL